MPSETELDSFWQATLERARAAPLEPEVQSVADPTPFQNYRITYTSLGGRRISARLGVPIRGEQPAVAATPLAAIVTAPGYGGWEMSQMLAECQRGYVVLQVYPRDQGESSGLARGEPIPPPQFLLRGIEKPEGYFYQGAYVDLVRAVDYLLTRDDVDAQRIGAIGTSQAGALALALGALDARVKAVVSHVPFFCDLRNNPASRLAELRRPERLATFDYFDPVNLAPRLRAPTLLSAGGRDETCPPQTIRAVFDRLPGIKCLAHYPDLPHTSCGDFYDMGWQWLDRYLRRAI